MEVPPAGGQADPGGHPSLAHTEPAGSLLRPFTGSGALDRHRSLAHAEPATSLTKSPKLRRGQLSFLSRTPETGSRRTASEVQESSSVGWRQAHEEPPPPDRAGNQSQAHEEPAMANAGHSQGSLSEGVNPSGRGEAKDDKVVDHAESA